MAEGAVAAAGGDGPAGASIVADNKGQTEASRANASSSIPPPSKESVSVAAGSGESTKAAALGALSEKAAAQSIANRVSRETKKESRELQSGVGKAVAKVKSSLPPASDKNPALPPVSGAKPLPPPKKIESTTRRKVSPGFFLVVTNSNGAADDNFELYFTPKDGSPQVKLPGVLDFTESDVAAYYYSWGIGAVAEEQVLSWLSEEIFDDPVYKNKEIKRSKIKLRPEQEGELFMKNVKTNDNGNYGTIVYGFARKRKNDFNRTLSYAGYSPPDGEDETIQLFYPPKK